MSECEDHLRQVICRMQESRNDLVSTLRQAARQLGYALVPLGADGAAPPTQTDERAQQALDDIDLARKFPVQGGFIEEQPSGWYPCRSAAPGSSTSSPAPTQEEQE